MTQTTQDFPRGARVLVHFDDHGPEHAPFEWTGRIVKSRIPGRVAVKSEYVTWKGPFYFDPTDDFVTVTRIAKNAPQAYREMYERDGHSGRISIRVPGRMTAQDYDYIARIYAAVAWAPGRSLIEILD